MAENDNLDLSAGDNPALRIKMGETGWIGLREFDGIILEQMRKDLTWPRANRTYQEMAEDSTIASALSLFSMMISRVNWKVVPPVDPTEDDLKKVQFLQQCMDDMEHSWFSFIKEVTSMFTYGYCVNEKVFRRRRKAAGSKFDDGLVGIRKLPVRSQTTIYRWLFDDTGRELTGVVQDTSFLVDGYRLANSSQYGGQIDIERKKFLLFRTDVSRDNPTGTSPLSKVYKSWRYRKQIEEAESVGITRGLGGIPRFDIPADYLKSDATQDQKDTVEAFKNIGRNLQSNEQACIIMPKFYDDQNNSLFDFELVGPPNASQYDTDKAITRWDNKILQALFADILQMGNSKGGSFNLADSKSSIVHMAVECYLKEIQDPLNTDLIPQLFALNGWELDRLPKFEYQQIKEEDLDVLSKYLQRAGSQGLIQKTPGNINQIADWIGLPDRIDSEEELSAYESTMTAFSSNAGEGMTSGLPSGTGKADGSSGDSSSSNSENT
jgi:Protein of unknown function (DUF935).